VFIDEERSFPMTSTTASPSTTAADVSPIALGAGEGEAIWAFGCLITLKSAGETTASRVMVTENLAARGAGSPLHVHHREDEWFYVMEGELTLWVGGEVIAAPAGSFVYGPRGIPHTFTVSSEEARFLLVAEPAGLEEMLRALGQPAASLTIPPAPTEPPDMARIVQVCEEHGLEILGPPGIPA
jgi:quercetin dioxygenase-like cupin family protein